MPPPGGPPSGGAPPTAGYPAGGPPGPRPGAPPRSAGGAVPPPPTPSVPMYSPPGHAAQPTAHVPTTPPPPLGGTVSSAAAAVRSPGYVPLTGGELDQPLSERFHALSIGGTPGSSAPSMPAAEQTPRPTAGELSECLRWDSREGGETLIDSCHPKFVRMTCNAMPNSSSAKAKAALPIGAIIQPLAKAEGVDIPIVNFGSSGVVRCGRCRTYINAFVQFADGGRRWRCNVCGKLNEVPPDYFCDLDGEGKRRDRMERPELHLGTVEFVAAAEYMVRPPQPPVYLFLIEVSYAAVASGMLRCVAATLQHTMRNLPGGERTQVGLITFDSTLHFYNLSGNTPQMMVVPEVEETFLPLPSDLLVNLHERLDSITSLFEKLPAMFASSQAVEVALGPALRAATQVVQHIGGKLALFSCTRPTIGEAKLKNREGGGRVKEDGKSASLLQPDCDFYKNMAVECSKQQVCVDIWSCGGAYTDLATIGQLAKHTTGAVSHYPSFSDVTQGEKLSRDLQHSLTCEQGWEAVMRVRVSRGLRISAFHGHFFIRGTDLLALPNIDEDKTFAIEIAHEENALSASSCCLQAALLYTTSSGERRIRVHTMELPVTSALATLYDLADVDACANLIGRVAVDTALSSRLLDGAEKMQNACLDLLRAYRSLCPPQAKTTSQLLLPRNLQLLPLYILGLMKSPLFSQSADIKADDRSYLFFLYSTMSCTQSSAFAHPRLIQVFPPKAAFPAQDLPLHLPLSSSALTADGAYLLDDGQSLTLWLGHAVPADFMQAAFGWPSLEGIDASTLRLLPAESTQMATHVHTLVELLRASRSGGWMALRVVKQGDGDSSFVRSLIEDQTKQMMSYPEFLVHCHRYVLSRVP